MPKTNGWTKLLIFAAGTLVAGGIAWGTLFTKVGTMGEKGCDPAQRHTTEIAVIQNSLENLEKGQETILEAIKAEK